MRVHPVAHARHMRPATAEMQYSAACATMPPDARQACESLVEAVSQRDLIQFTAVGSAWDNSLGLLLAHFGEEQDIEQRD